MSEAIHGDEVTPGQPSVSVVVATHNRPEMLRGAVNAILAQEYDGDVEVVVVYDRSEPDPDIELLSIAGGPNERSARVITNTRTPGLAGARNSGVLVGSSDLVAFCDDDDEWLPGKLAAQVAVMTPSDVGAVTGIRIDYGEHQTERVPEGDRLVLDDLVANRVMEAHPSTVIVRRDALMGDIGLVDEDIPGSYGEDFDWILRAVEAGGMAIAAQPLVMVRWGQSLFSRNWSIIVEAIDYVLDKHPRLRASSNGHARLLGRRAFANAAMGHRSEALRDSWKTLRLRPTERRAFLAIAVSLRLVKAERLMSWAHRRGKGI